MSTVHDRKRNKHKIPQLLIATMSLIVLAAAAYGFFMSPMKGSPISEGNVAPAFSLPTADGRTVALDNFVRQKDVLLYFSMGPG